MKEYYLVNSSGYSFVDNRPTGLIRINDGGRFKVSDTLGVSAKDLAEAIVTDSKGQVSLEVKEKFEKPTIILKNVVAKSKRKARK